VEQEALTLLGMRLPGAQEVRILHDVFRESFNLAWIDNDERRIVGACLTRSMLLRALVDARALWP
jgi:hypothetical protein